MELLLKFWAFEKGSLVSSGAIHLKISILNSFFSPILSLFLFFDFWFSSCQLDVFNSIVHRCGGQREGEHSENPCALKMPRAMCERT